MIRFLKILSLTGNNNIYRYTSHVENILCIFDCVKKWFGIQFSEILQLRVYIK